MNALIPINICKMAKLASQILNISLPTLKDQNYFQKLSETLELILDANGTQIFFERKCNVRPIFST